MLPAWIEVGTLDLFHDEDVAYGRRLNAAGVECCVVEGAYHAFDVLRPGTPAARRFMDAMLTSLAAGLQSR